MSLLQSFTSKAGEGVADTWIRKEITSNLGNLRTHTYVTRASIESTAEIFLTCDLMNALAAVAEILNTFYFYSLRTKNWPYW